MSKIQRKLSIKELAPYQGTEQYIDFILTSHQTIRAKLLSITNESVSTKNALGHKKTIALSDIKQSWLDEKYSQS